MEKEINQPHIEAISRFEKLWQDAQVSLSEKTIEPARVENGNLLPIEYCLSSLALLYKQPDGMSICNQIHEDLNRSKALKDQLIYPKKSMHITLVGATRRQKKFFF